MQKGNITALSVVVKPALHHVLNGQLVDTFGFSLPETNQIITSIDLTQLVRAKPMDIPKLLLHQIQKPGNTVIRDTVIAPMLHRILNEQLVDTFGLNMDNARSITHNVDLTQLVRAKPEDIPKLLLSYTQGDAKDVVSTVVTPMLHRMLQEQLVDRFGLSVEGARVIPLMEISRLPSSK